MGEVLNETISAADPDLLAHNLADRIAGMAGRNLSATVAGKKGTKFTVTGDGKEKTWLSDLYIIGGGGSKVHLGVALLDSGGASNLVLAPAVTAETDAAIAERWKETLSAAKTVSFNDLTFAPGSNTYAGVHPLSPDGENLTVRLMALKGPDSAVFRVVTNEKAYEGCFDLGFIEDPGGDWFFLGNLKAGSDMKERGISVFGLEEEVDEEKVYSSSSSSSSSVVDDEKAENPYEAGATHERKVWFAPASSATWCHQHRSALGNVNCSRRFSGNTHVLESGKAVSFIDAADTNLSFPSSLFVPVLSQNRVMVKQLYRPFGSELFPLWYLIAPLKTAEKVSLGQVFAAGGKKYLPVCVQEERGFLCVRWE